MLLSIMQITFKPFQGGCLQNHNILCFSKGSRDISYQMLSTDLNTLLSVIYRYRDTVKYDLPFLMRHIQ